MTARFGLGKASKSNALCNYKKAEAIHVRANFSQEILDIGSFSQSVTLKEVGNKHPAGGKDSQM